MAYTIKSMPANGAYYLVKDIPKIIIESDEPMQIIVKHGGKELISDIYSPDPQNIIKLDIRNIIDEEIPIFLPIGTNAVVSKVPEHFEIIPASVYDDPHESFLFDAIKGTQKEDETLLQNKFLTNQQTEKKVAFNYSTGLPFAPEFLKYYSNLSGDNSYQLCFVATNKDGSTITDFVTTINSGQEYLFSLSQIIKEKITNSRELKSLELYIGKGSTKLSNVQKYQFIPAFPFEEYFAFGNPLGGIDTVRCTGKLIFAPEYEMSNALMGDVELTYSIERKDLHTSYTGWLTQKEFEWIVQLLSSKEKYVLINDNYTPIIVDEIDAEYDNKNNLHSITLTWRAADKNDEILNNIYKDNSITIPPIDKGYNYVAAETDGLILTEVGEKICLNG